MADDPKPDESADATARASEAPKASGPVATDPSLVDNPFAPEHFAADAVGFYLAKPGLVHITLTAPRVDHRTSPGPVNRVVVQRLVMPVEGAYGLAVGLYDFLQKNADALRQAGIELPGRGEATN
jgi:hypothetical protein